MKYILSLLVLILISFSCSDMELTSQDLCIPVVCGKLENNDVNLALYNDSGVDFDALYYDIGGQNDSVGFFPLKQYTCWINLDTLKTDYFLARGISDDIVFQSDTLWMQQKAKILTSGVYVLEIYKEESNNELYLQFVEDYSGECKNL
ncbi:hypothetical protein ABWH96_13180 [Marivirga tractuosa]|uniref:hypothetical protein n=1 Tax=Marivirga tractuosa TaxID=1006 RepID=UPI0035D01949